MMWLLSIWWSPAGSPWGAGVIARLDTGDRLAGSPAAGEPGGAPLLSKVVR